MTMKPRSGMMIASAFFTLSISGLACGSNDDAPVAAETAPMTPVASPAVGVSCPTRGALVPPSMPSSVAPPAGAQLFLRVYAEGTQIYTCQAGTTGAYAWTFKAPEAKLYDDRCVLVGSHFAGPSWKIEKDGSTVVGKKTGEAPSPTAGSIPWLLLSTNTISGSGTLTPVTYVNRLDTAGGVAPADGCDAGAAGKEIAVPYTATYLFYKAAAETKTTSNPYPY
jgi:hypothetical protein